MPADNLLVAWESHHFLAALLLKTVESYLTAQDRPMRLKAIMLLVAVMSQHELDTRCAEPATRDRVALLYLPWLPILSQVRRPPTLILHGYSTQTWGGNDDNHKPSSLKSLMSNHNHDSLLSHLLPLCAARIA